MDSETVVGTILAGGHSRRLGRDKALLDLGDGHLLGRAVVTLDAVFDRVVIVAPTDRGYERFGAEVVPDVETGSGPVAGLCTGLRMAGGHPVFLLACDLPNIDVETVRWIVSHAGSPATGSGGRSPQVVVAVDGGRLQPLCALYDGSCLPMVEEALADGRWSVTELLGRLDCLRLDLDPNATWYHHDLFFNINDPRDVEAWKGRRGSSR